MQELELKMGQVGVIEGHFDEVAPPISMCEDWVCGRMAGLGHSTCWII